MCYDQAGRWENEKKKITSQKNKKSKLYIIYIYYDP